MMLTFGKKVLIISSCVVLLWITIGIFVYRSSFQLLDQGMKIFSPVTPPKEQVDNCKTLRYSGFWRNIDLNKKEIPQSVKDAASSVTVHSNSITIQSTEVHYIYAKPNDISSNIISILFLHGQSFTSETWNKLGTIKLFAALGHFPVAVDLPGYGKTPSIPTLNKAYFLDKLISALNLQKPVLVSPSMSGSFSMKFLIEHPDKLGGFVPVSPVQTTILDKSPCKYEKKVEVPLSKDCQKIKHLLEYHPNLNCIKVATLVVWGEKDRGENSAKLCLLPESQGIEIPEGEHPAYLSNPDLWHKSLYNFLSVLNETQNCKEKLS